MRASTRQPANHCLAGTSNPATPSQHHVPGQRIPTSLSLGTAYAPLLSTQLTACCRCALRRYPNRRSFSTPSCDRINEPTFRTTHHQRKYVERDFDINFAVAQLHALIHRIVVLEPTSCHCSRSLRKLPNSSRDCKLHDKLAQAPGITTGRGPSRLP